MAQTLQAITDFHTYPAIGEDDWRYAFATAEIRALETGLLTRAHRSFAEMEIILGHRRREVRELFEMLCIDDKIVELFKSRDDFTNIRLALRRMLTEKPLGSDYSGEGNLEADQYEEIFEQENQALLPDYLQQAVDEAVLEYYGDKNVRQIDFALDKAQARFNLQKASELESIFLSGLFRVQIDLNNIRTMLRLKFTESELRNVFIEGGFVELDRLEKARDLGYEAIAPLFFASPYHRLVETGIAYLASEKSFLKIEQQCDEYINGFLRSTSNITAGHQPVVAYLLLKEHEIRNVRLILTAKKNGLENKLILDRIT
ncbi:MAG: V-type ATPase subunit [Planctomycetota bacterium]|jgi:V/A-type H+-transporting ATPase subunit C